MGWRGVVTIGAVALAAQAALAQDRPPSDKRPGAPVPFLWGGQRIDTLTWGNAERIRDEYLPAMAAYPNPAACARADGADEAPPVFTRSDLIALPDLAAKTVCLFYYVQPVDGTEAMVAALEELGFRENYRGDRRDGIDLTFYWNRENGPLQIRRGLARWWFDLISGGTALEITIMNGRIEWFYLVVDSTFQK